VRHVLHWLYCLWDFLVPAVFVTHLSQL
jgi:hypothetical protein